ncbi:MAG: class I SAM-dependent methyltransferase [Eubacterium sp.]|nr:class I SAM-dependent methyltransferase [Eubacterium sp.]
MKEKKKKGISQDLLAAIFDTSEFKQYAHDSRQEAVEALNGHSFETLLDLDCGGGKLLEQLFETFPHMKASGFDYSLDRLAGAKERLAGKCVELKLGNATNLPYKDNSFDVVVSTATFHHYHTPELVLKEVHRVLVPKGVFVICDTYLNATLRYLNHFCKPINEVDIHIYSEKEIWQMLNGAGFTGISWKQLNRYTYLAKAYTPQITLAKSEN